MPERKPGRLLATVATAAAPGLLVLAALFLAGTLAAWPALLGTVVLAALTAVIARRHAAGLDRLRQRIDRLAQSGEDLNLDAPTLPELSLAVGRLGRAWQETREESDAKSAAADRKPVAHRSSC